MQAVNLLPAYAKPGHRWVSVGKDLAPRRVLTVGGITAAVAAVAVGGLYAYERHVVSDKRSELATTQARLTAVDAQAAPFRATQAQVSSRRTAATTIVEHRIPWETVLAGLSRVLPSQVYLTSMQATTPIPAAALTPAAPVPGAAATTAAPAPAPTVAPTGFTVAGVATSQVRVALVLDRLALMPWLSDVTLGSVTSTSSGPNATGGGDQFSIQAVFSAAGGGQ